MSLPMRYTVHPLIVALVTKMSLLPVLTITTDS